MGKKSGVSTQIFAEQSKAVAIHCQGHSLSLSVKSLTNKCDILRHTLSVVGEICILVKFSPKRENLLGNINGNIEKGQEDVEQIKKLTKLSITHATVGRVFRRKACPRDKGKDYWLQEPNGIVLLLLWLKPISQALCHDR